MVMTPPYAQRHCEPAARAGLPPILVRGAPGIHVPAALGRQGIGVRTPRAALVAAATDGLLNVVHMANGGMLAFGTTSAVVAAGLPSIVTRLTGKTLRVAGAVPKLHCNIAVDVTFGCPMM